MVFSTSRNWCSVLGFFGLNPPKQIERTVGVIEGGKRCVHPLNTESSFGMRVVGIPPDLDHTPIPHGDL